MYRGSSPRPIIKYITKAPHGVNWIKIGDMPENGNFVANISERITPEGAKKSRKVEIGDIILSNSMSFGKPYIMGVAGYIHDGWFVIREFEKYFDKEYLCQLLVSPFVQNQYKKLAAGGVVLNISSDLVNSVNVPIISIVEQKKIANFLSLIDQRIEKQRQLVESLKKYKRGYLKALIKKLNTTEFLLENIVEEYQNKTILNMQYPILSSTMNGIKLQDDYFNKQAASENTIGYKIVPKGYFTYRSMSDTGVFRFNRQMLVGNGIVSPAYPVFKVKSEEANPIFVEYMLNEDDKIKEQLLTQKEGGTRYALSFSKFKSLKINLPDINIQEKIAIQITLLNTLVKKQEAYLHCLNKNKCGLLQQMFI